MNRVIDTFPWDNKIGLGSVGGSVKDNIIEDFIWNHMNDKVFPATRSLAIRTILGKLYRLGYG